MYTDRNFKSEKELRAAVDAWNAYAATTEGSPERIAITREGREPTPVHYHQPGPFGGSEPRDGTIHCEGPHYPQPHRWYAQCEVKGGVIVKVK